MNTGTPDDYKQACLIGKLFYDPTLVPEDKVVMAILGLSDEMDVNSLAPIDAYECAYVSYLIGKSELMTRLLDYACLHEEPHAMFKKASMFHGEGKYEEARKLHFKAAEAGLVEAQHIMGCYYYYGWGVGIDYAEAMKWYLIAAENGGSQAQCDLGVCYYSGHGTDVNYEMAVYWYRKSVDQGESQAMYNLGSCYLLGHGVAYDLKQAAMYFEMAEEHGHPYASAKVQVCRQML